MSIEAQQLLQHTLAKFIATATAQSAELVALTKASSKQSDEVVRLTEQLRKLTVWITWLTVAATVFGGVQAAAVIVRFVRWSRGLP